MYADEIAAFGPTPGCYRCNNMFDRGGAHSDECRTRVWRSIEERARCGSAWAQRKLRIEEERQQRLAERDGAGGPAPAPGTGDDQEPPSHSTPVSSIRPSTLAAQGQTGVNARDQPRPPTIPHSQGTTFDVSDHNDPRPRAYEGLPQRSGRKRDGEENPDDPGGKYQELEALTGDTPATKKL